MPPWFDNLAVSEQPEAEQLQEFVRKVQEFLRYVLKRRVEFAFLWEDAPNLRRIAAETFASDLRDQFKLLRSAVPQISRRQLTSHGLLGRPLRFKFKVLASIAGRWERVKREFTIRGWFKQVCEAIDAILDSLIQAAGGVGGGIKEFKDALSALAKTVEPPRITARRGTLARRSDRA
jgi:hypothetical protein